MNDYIELRCDIEPCSETITDVLAALLADEGFESFVPDAGGLTAYVRKELYDREACEAVCRAFPLPASMTLRETLVEGRDWNSEWEKNYFQPIVVGDRCVIHSSFHRDIPRCEYDIVIDPKMAFGTGHHSTTSLILRRLLAADLTGLKVIDMGTGTGILAILAAMRGAGKVIGIEIDPFAYENALDNVRLNGHPEITILRGDASRLAEAAPDGAPADLLMANINRNVIVADLPAYAAAVRPGGSLIFSGFYVDDAPVVEKAARECGLEPAGITSDNNWASMLFRKL